MIPEHSLDSDDWLEPVQCDDENEELDQQDRENHENEQESIRAELAREFPEDAPAVSVTTCDQCRYWHPHHRCPHCGEAPHGW